MRPKWLIYRRLPWIRVVEMRDCGAAAFASIAGYYGHHLSLEQARGLVGTDRDGTTLLGLRDGGRAIGLDSRPAEATFEGLANVQLPAIVHTEGGEGHFLILYHWNPTKLTVLDPNRGIVRLSRAEFEAAWSGYLIEYRPTPALQPRARELRPARLFLDLVRQHKAPLAFALGFALLATSLGWSSSFFMRALIDRILPNRETGLLAALGVALIFVSASQALLQLGRMLLLARVGRRIQRNYSLRFIKQLFALPIKVFDARCVPGLVLRVNQAETVQQAATDGMILLVADAVTFFAAFGILLAYSPITALIAFTAVPLTLIVIMSLNSRVYNTQLSTMVRSDEFSGHMIDTFDGLRTIKMFGAEPRYEQLLTAKLDGLIAARYSNRMAMMLPATWSMLAMALVSSCVLWYGSTQVMAGRLTPGDLIVLFGMVAFYLNPVQRFPNQILNLRAALIGLSRIEEIVALPTEQARITDPVVLPPVQGRIEFQNVWFSYKARRPVLKNISFGIAPGETIAIVGETGSGKTSLANLIAGFYLPDQGDVRIDGISTRQIMPTELRREISAVFQSGRLFQHSVRENIAMLDDVSLAQVERAATMANGATFINELVQGYDTQVARGGDNFSSGQAQRISLARALLKDAPILLLDEATSNLDGETEQGILQALDQERHNRTTVIVAHRLSTVLHADRIFVMDRGQLVEAGTHAELLQRQGRYFDLFRWQIMQPAEES